MYLVIHAYDCHERNVQSPRRRKRCEEGCWSTGASIRALGLASTNVRDPAIDPEHNVFAESRRYTGKNSKKTPGGAGTPTGYRTARTKQSVKEILVPPASYLLYPSAPTVGVAAWYTYILTHASCASHLSHRCHTRLLSLPAQGRRSTLVYSTTINVPTNHRPASRYPRGACAERSDPRARALWVSSLSQTRMGFVTKSDPRARALDEHLRRDAQLAVDQEEGVSHELWKSARAAARRLHRPQQSRLDLERHDGRAP